MASWIYCFPKIDLSQYCGNVSRHLSVLKVLPRKFKTGANIIVHTGRKDTRRNFDKLESQYLVSPPLFLDWAWTLLRQAFTPHTLLRYAKFSANSSLEITLLVKKCYLMSLKLCYLWYFSENEAREMGTNDVLLQQTVSDKVPYDVSCLLYEDTALVHPWVGSFFFCAWMIHISVLSGLTKQKNKERERKQHVPLKIVTRTGLKTSEKAAFVQRKTLNSLENYCWRPI